MDIIEILTNYILSLEDDIPEEDCKQKIDLPIFRGNSLMGNNSRNNTKRSSFQKIKEDVHSPFLIKGNYYNGERKVAETRILIDTGASCNHIQADKCKMIGNITSPYVILYLSNLSRKLFLREYHSVNFLAFYYLCKNLPKRLFPIILWVFLLLNCILMFGHHNF